LLISLILVIAAVRESGIEVELITVLKELIGSCSGSRMPNSSAAKAHRYVAINEATG